ncbi:MAG: hypothetical protein AAFV45_03725 [Pseudomonadota bacterium]
MTTLEIVGIVKIIALFGGVMAYLTWSGQKLKRELKEMREARTVTLQSLKDGDMGTAGH